MTMKHKGNTEADCVSLSGTGSIADFTVDMDFICPSTVRVGITKNNYADEWFGIVFSEDMIGQALVHTVGKATEDPRPLALYSYNNADRRRSEVTWIDTLTWNKINESNDGGVFSVIYEAQDQELPGIDSGAIASIINNGTYRQPFMWAFAMNAGVNELANHGATNRASIGEQGYITFRAVEVNITTPNVTISPNITMAPNVTMPDTTMAPKCGYYRLQPLDVCTNLQTSSSFTSRKLVCNESSGVYQERFYSAANCPENRFTRFDVKDCDEGFDCVCGSGDLCDYAKFRAYTDEEDTDIDNSTNSTDTECVGEEYIEASLVLNFCGISTALNGESVQLTCDLSKGDDALQIETCGDNITNITTIPISSLNMTTCSLECVQENTTTTTSRPTMDPLPTPMPTDSLSPTMAPTTTPECGRWGPIPLDTCQVNRDEDSVSSTKYTCTPMNVTGNGDRRNVYMVNVYENDDCSGDPDSTETLECDSEGIGCVCSSLEYCDYTTFTVYVPDFDPFPDPESTMMPFNMTFGNTDMTTNMPTPAPTMMDQCSGDESVTMSLVLNECIPSDDRWFPFASTKILCADDGTLSMEKCVPELNITTNFTSPWNFTIPPIFNTSFTPCDTECNIRDRPSSDPTTSPRPTVQPSPSCYDKTGSVQDEDFMIEFTIKCKEEKVILDLTYDGYLGNWFGINYPSDEMDADPMVGNALLYTTGKRNENLGEAALYPYRITDRNGEAVNYDQNAGDWTKISEDIVNGSAFLSYEQDLSKTEEFNLDTSSVNVRWAFGEVENGLEMTYHGVDGRAAQTLNIELQDVITPTPQPSMDKPTMDPGHDDDFDESGIIIGIVVGVFFFLFLICIIIMAVVDNKRSKEAAQQQSTGQRQSGGYDAVGHDTDVDTDVEMAGTR